MFGYIVPEKPELKIKEYELFKAYYCGICKSIGRRYGQLPRFTLNYDSAFLALLLSSLADSKAEIRRERCIAHPLKKRNVLKSTEILDYAADMNIVLAYYNLVDNWKDEKSVVGYTGALALRKAYKKISKRHEKKCRIIRENLERLNQLEKEKCNSIDEAAEPFSKLMAEIMAYETCCEDENREKILRWIGYNIGKWIYVLDAYDDLEKDVKNKAYNPLIYQYEYKDGDIKDFKTSILSNTEFILTYCLDQITKTYELLGNNKNKGLVENILYLGMLRKTDQILKFSNSKKCKRRDG